MVLVCCFGDPKLGGALVHQATIPPGRDAPRIDLPCTVLPHLFVASPAWTLRI